MVQEYKMDGEIVYRLDEMIRLVELFISFSYGVSVKIKIDINNVREMSLLGRAFDIANNHQVFKLMFF